MRFVYLLRHKVCGQGLQPSGINGLTESDFALAATDPNRPAPIEGAGLLLSRSLFGFMAFLGIGILAC